MTTLRARTLAQRLMIACAFAITAMHAAADDYVLNPATHVSPSGRYELFVDPSAMSGAGPATYRLTRDGEVVWAGERPFSLWEAKVTDSGAVVGYAYEDGVAIPGNHGAGYNGLSIVVLDAEGRTLTRDPVSAHDTGFQRNSWAGSDSPRVHGLVVDQQNDRFAVVIPLAGNEDPVVWWTYRISDGEWAGDVVPEHPVFAKQSGNTIHIATLAVPGTPLTLVHWFLYNYTGRELTRIASLGLLDTKGREVWRLDLPDEYDGFGENWNWWDLTEPGAEQVEVGARGFSFRSHSLSLRISFALEPSRRARSGWRVVETGRLEDRPPVGPAAQLGAEIEAIELERLGEIELKTPGAAPSPIGGIREFAIDPVGAIGFVRAIADKPVRFIRVDPAGKVLTDIALDPPGGESSGVALAVSVADERWVVARSSYAEKTETQAWWLDIETGDLDPIEAFGPAGAGSLAPTGDGGFVAFTKHFLKYTIQDELSRYDADGERLWSTRELGQNFSLQAATWIGDGGVAALMGISNTIEFIDAQGEHERSVKLADILGAKPNYPSGLTTDLSGGLVLHDFNGSPPIHRISAEGEVVASFHPRFADGRTFRIHGDVQVAPDGGLWTSDGHALLRLSDEGVVDRILGPRPDDDALENILVMTVGPDGRIYAVNERTAAAHVFGSDGAPLRTLKPRPTDFVTSSGVGSVTVAGDGAVYYKTGGESAAEDREAYLGFTAQGERMGFAHLGIDSITEDWLFKPNSLERWALGYEAVHLVDAGGAVIKTIARRPNGDWLQSVNDGAVAPDGSLAVIASPAGWATRGPVTVNIYGADGEPIRTIPLTEEAAYARVAFNGSSIITASGGAVYVYNVNGGAPRKFVPPAAGVEEAYWWPFVSPDGTELWLRASGSTTLTRYKLP